MIGIESLVCQQGVGLHRRSASHLPDHGLVPQSAKKANGLPKAGGIAWILNIRLCFARSSGPFTLFFRVGALCCARTMMLSIMRIHCRVGSQHFKELHTPFWAPSAKTVYVRR